MLEKISFTDVEWIEFIKEKNQDWADILASKLKEINPICSLAFKRRWVKRNMTTVGHFIMTCDGYCTFSSCSVKVRVEVMSQQKESGKFIANIEYDSKPLHHCEEAHSRQIKASYRSRLRSNFATTRIPPSRMYHQKLSKLSETEYVGGNRDGIGSRDVLKKVSGEARHIDEMHFDLTTSLEMMAKQEEEDTKYIRCIQVLPFTVILFNEAGIALYHELAPTVTMFCDATGSITKVPGPGKRTLYYAIVLPHPIKGRAPLAVAELITTDHTVNSVTYFLRTVRSFEGKVYGFRNLCTPRRLVIDKSLVLLISFLEVYNRETIMDYLLRTFRIVTGEGALGDFQLIMPYACKSHTMKLAKDHIRKRYIACMNLAKIVNMKCMHVH